MIWKDGPHHARAGAFYSDFSNYIALLGTGQQVPTDEGTVPVYAYTGVPAQLYGLELEGNWRVLDDVHQLDLRGKLDLMRATDESSGQPMPRIPPARLTAAVDWRMGPWAALAEVIHAAAQQRVPDRRPGDTGLYAGQPGGELQAAHNRRRRLLLREAEQPGQRAGLQRDHDRHRAAAGTVARTRPDGRIASELLVGWRRDPESNRAERICNPVHNRFAIAPWSRS